MYNYIDGLIENNPLLEILNIGKDELSSEEVVEIRRGAKAHCLHGQKAEHVDGLRSQASRPR